jgi:hypothetical protein
MSCSCRYISRALRGLGTGRLALLGLVQRQQFVLAAEVGVEAQRELLQREHALRLLDQRGLPRQDGSALQPSSACRGGELVERAPQPCTGHTQIYAVLAVAAGQWSSVDRWQVLANIEFSLLWTHTR